MTEKEYSDEEIEDLDSFLQFEFYYEIYKELTDKNNKNYGLFEPLECCELMFQTVGLVEEKKTKPLTVSKYLKNELTLSDGEKPLTEEQRYFFYKYVLDFFVNVRGEDEQIEICCSEILRLQANLDVSENKTQTPKQKDAFEIVMEKLKSLPTLKEKIAYLINVKTHYEQNKSDWNRTFGDEKNFTEKCDLEITRLRGLWALEKEEIASKNEQRKHKDLTLDRAVLALNYLLNELNPNCKTSKKKEFIDFITPYSPNTIKTKLENLHEKADLKPKKYEEDLQIISKYFENLGLTKIVDQIKRDLEFE